MKPQANFLRNLMPAIVVAMVLFISAGAADAQDPLDDPEFDAEIHIQPFQTSYQNREIMPQNNTNTGSATYSLAIKVPPGRGGVQPGLALRYNSRQKNGWLGMGWSLDMGAIQRSTRWGLDYNANNFTVNGSVELKTRSDWGADYYETEIEAAFTKYQVVSATGGWVAYAKDGTRSYYGTTSNSRQENPNGVFKWCLDRVEDANGNAMTVTYLKDQGQIYLARIDYTDGSYYVLFTLENRPDGSTQHNTHSAVTTAKRLKQIDTYGNGSLASSYILEYELGYFSRRSRLKQVKRNLLPPTVFYYQDGGTGTFDSYVETEAGLLGGMEDPRDYLVDLNGDGRADLVRRHRPASIHTYYTYLGRNDGTFGSATINEIDALTYEMPIVYFADIDGDGRTDLIKRSTNDLFQVHRSERDGTFSAAVETDLPVMTGEMGRIHFADINGDGRSDLIIRDTHNIFHVHHSAGEGTFDEAVETDLPVMTGEMGDIYFHDINGDNRADLIIRNTSGLFHTHFGKSDGTLGTANSTETGVMPNEMGLIYFADVNGDGITDLIKRNTNGRFNTYPSLGNGTFGSPTSTETGAKLSESGYIDFADINGDGLADLLKHDLVGNYFSYMSRGDGTFGEERITATGQMILEKSQIYFADIDGDGLADLFKRNKNGTVRVHRADGEAADLLSEIGFAVDDDPADGNRSITAFTYRPSPLYDNTVLPFIVQTVASQTLSVATLAEDGSGVTSITGYNYSGGYYDARQREFRGFQQTVQTNPDSTTVTRQFHQDDFFKSKEALVEFKDSQGGVLTRTTFLWDKEFVDAPQDTIAFVRLDQKHSEFFLNPTVYRQTDYTYDAIHGGLLTATSSGSDAESVTTANLYQNYGDWLWRQTRKTATGAVSGKVRETYYEYEIGSGNLLAKKQWLDGGVNPKISMIYDAYGNPVTVSDAKGNTTTIEYDTVTHMYPIRITSPSTNGISHIVEHPKYDYRWGKVKTTKDENGQNTYYGYDDLGRLVSVDYPDGGQVKREYDDHIAPILVTTRVKKDADDDAITFAYYDGLYRNTITITVGELVDGSSRLVRSDRLFDEMGRNYLTYGPYFYGDTADFPWRRTTFDDLGRPVRIEQPDSEYGTVASAFTYQGFNLTATDPDGASKIEHKDSLGRIMAVVEHADEGDLTTTYAYNAAGDMGTVTDHYGNQIRMDYDTLGRKIQLDDPNMGVWTYAYDANGNLTTQTDYKSQTINFGYDELNRLQSKTYSTLDPAVTYVYDNLTIPNGRGRLYSLSNTLVTDTINAYDAMGRETSVSKAISGNSIEYLTQYQYDLAGRLRQIIYPDQYEVNYLYYPASGLLRKVVGFDPADSTRYYEHYFVELSDYTPIGQTSQIDYGGYYLVISGNVLNGSPVLLDRYIHNPLSARLEKITTQNTADMQYLQWIEYQYTPAGDIKEKTDNVRENTYTYLYDKLHRLVEEQAVGYLPSIQNTALDYGYDEAYQPHAVKHITLNGSDGYDYQYDDNGNMEAGPDFSDPARVIPRSIVYNADNRPVSIVHDETGTTEFVYDGRGQRAKKTLLGSVSTYYIGDHYEVNEDKATKYIFAGNRRIAKHTGDTVYYYHRDHLGSSTLMTDGSGAELESTDYLPFGHQREHTGASVTDYKYTDQEYDAATGLYNYDARLYDPVIGRFITADSIIPSWYDPQALGRYTYTRNNPLKYTDPDGHSLLLAIIVGVALAYITDSILTPDMANAPESVATPLEDTSAIEHAGSLLTGASIGVTAVAGGFKAAGQEILEEVIDEASGGVTSVARIVKNAPKKATIPDKLYRSGGKNPGSLTPREIDQGMLSTRDSLSNPWPLKPGQKPVIPAGKPVQVIDTSKLPPGSVVPDGFPYGSQQAGHVSIGPDVHAQTVKDAIVETLSKNPENWF